MSVETVTTTQDLNASNPAAGDVLTEGDNHLRIMKVGAKVLCWEHVGTANFAAVSSVSTYVQFGAFVAGYDYQVTLEGVYGSAASTVQLRVTTAGGSVDSGSNYAYSVYQGSTNAGVGASSGTEMQQVDAFGDAVDEPATTEITILNPQGTTNPRHVLYTGIGGATSASLVLNFGGGMYKSTTAVDGIYLMPASGTFTGTIKLYRRFRAV